MEQLQHLSEEDREALAALASEATTAEDLAEIAAMGRHENARRAAELLTAQTVEAAKEVRALIAKSGVGSSASEVASPTKFLVDQNGTLLTASETAAVQSGESKGGAYGDKATRY